MQAQPASPWDPRGAPGKGGVIGVLLFPILMHRGGLRLAEGVAAAVSVAGIFVTVTMLPETKGKSLEELTPETAG